MRGPQAAGRAAPPAWSDGPARGLTGFGRYPGYTRGRLEQFAERLRASIYSDKAGCRSLEVAGPVGRLAFGQAKRLTYEPASLGMPLSPAWSTFWCRARFTVPETWAGSRVDLHFNSHSEGLVWFQGQSIQGLNPAQGDHPARTEAALLRTCEGGEELEVWIEVACNKTLGLDVMPGRPDGVLQTEPRSPFWLEGCELRRFDEEAYGLLYDFEVLRQLEADRAPRQASEAVAGEKTVVRPALGVTWANRLLRELNAVCREVNPADRSTWPAGRERLSKLLQTRNGDCVHHASAVGHAHIDTAWLWPLSETDRKCQRTFSSVVSYMERYPEFTFACSQAYQYARVAELNPDLFRRILARVEQGQWCPVGGTWIEPDCNLPSGESLCRQFLYGQQFFEAVFGQRSNIFWNPDTFGYNGQLPQIVRLCGIDYFLTQKLSWNRFTSPRHHTFYWRGIDGTEVLTHFPPADSYLACGRISELRYQEANYKDSDRSEHGLYVYGLGDGGGGPTPEMLEVIRRTADLQGVPKTAPRSPQAFFQQLEADLLDGPRLQGELYFEYHRGTYTSVAELKRLNRRVEELLHDVELLDAMLTARGGREPDLAWTAVQWKQLLLHQFHDILPGTSVKQVNDEAIQALRATHDALIDRRGKLLAALALPRNGHTDDRGGAQPFFNTLSFPRREVVDLPDGSAAMVEAAPFAAARQALTEDRVVLDPTSEGWVISNDTIRVELHRDGRVLSLVHEPSGRECLSEPGNLLLEFDDRPNLWDAWDIDPFTFESARQSPPCDRAEVEREDALQMIVRFERRIGADSRMVQRVIVRAESPVVEFDTRVDWRERHCLLKTAFPIDVVSDSATFEMPFGVAERPVHTNSEADLAKYEVPAHRWADLGEPGFGVALVNDSKYGYAVRGGLLTLSLLRGPCYPDPDADLGTHQFRYGIMPHSGDWRSAGVVQTARAFNQPMVPTGSVSGPAGGHAGPFMTADCPGLVIDTVKPAEDGEGIVVRAYEAHGNRCRARFRCEPTLRSACLVNVLEDRLGDVPLLGRHEFELEVRPYQIVSIKLHLDM